MVLKSRSIHSDRSIPSLLSLCLSDSHVYVNIYSIVILRPQPWMAANGIFIPPHLWICFGWMTPLMKQGHKRPIIDKDVWRLDTWDLTQTLIKGFTISWVQELQKSRPWLLGALNSSLGKRL